MTISPSRRSTWSEPSRRRSRRPSGSPPKRHEDVMKIALLLIGLVIGGLVGWATMPAGVEINAGPLSLEVQGGSGGGGMSVEVQKDRPAGSPALEVKGGGDGFAGLTGGQLQ